MIHTQLPEEEKEESKIVGKHTTIISPFLTQKEIADYYRCSTVSIRRRVKKGLIKETRENGCILYNIKDNRIKL